MPEHRVPRAPDGASRRRAELLGETEQRRRGGVASAARLGSSGHVSWAYADDSSFHRAATEFLADGLRLGQRLLYVTSEPRESQRAALAPLGDVGCLLERGELIVSGIDDAYDIGRPIDPEAQLGAYAAITDQALADGFTGLRVAANATALVSDAALREAHVRWESFADRYMAGHPLAALCAYDERAVAGELLEQLHRVHPASHGVDLQLSFRAAYLDGHTLALEGEVDTFSTEPFGRLLDLTLSGASDPVDVDLGALRFINHRGLCVLTDHVRQHGLRLVRVPPAVRHLSELLDLAA